MATAVRAYVRADEKQFVFIVAVGEEFVIVETAELWEEPIDPFACYFCYPTVLGTMKYATLLDAAAAVGARYPWARDGGPK